MCRFAMILILLASLPFTTFAQSLSPKPAADLPTSSPALSPGSGSSEQESGLLSYIDFGGSSNSAGRIFTLDFSAGYQFNRRVSVDALIPFYFVPAITTASSTGGRTQQTTLSDHGIGDPSFALMLRFPNPVLDYKTRVTTWVPVANLSSGFTTGSVLVDWANRFSRPVGRLIPFAQVDIGNTVPDTQFFLLPYTAKGLNARFEAGANIALTRILSAGASAYYVAPFGQQHLYSRMCGDSGSVSGGGGYQDGWMTQQVTTGNDLTRDHGFSTWLVANLPHYVDVYVGFTRSYGYNLNTVSFGVGFDVAGALRHGRE